MNKRWWRRSVAPALVAIVWCAACVRSGLPEPIAFPEGTYTYVDAPSPASTDPAAGRGFEFVDRRYVFYRDRVPVITGSYESAGDTLRLSGENGLPWDVCPEAGEPGVYAWRVEDNRLIIEDIEDSCARRQRELTLAPLTAGFPEPPSTASVPEEIRSQWHAWFGPAVMAGDERVALLRDMLTDDAQFLGVTGKAAILEFAADFFCAKGGRPPDSENYRLYGPCEGSGVSERVEVYPFLFERTEGRILERGRHVLSLTAPSAGTVVGVGRYEVIWVEQPDGSWKIVRMGD
jgi:hypothetical protein